MSNLAQFNSNNANSMLQHQLSNQSAGGVVASSAGKMWSNFGSTKDNSKKKRIYRI
jgi:hypothetical protein